MRAAALPPVVLAVAALASGGCGAQAANSAKDFTGREKVVAQTVDDLAAAARKVDARKICDAFLTRPLKDRLGGTRCADRLHASIQDADAFDLRVESVRLSGARATVRVKTHTSRGQSPVDVLQMVEQRGWRIAVLP